jgi:hypothetical protein
MARLTVVSIKTNSRPHAHASIPYSTFSDLTMMNRTLSSMYPMSSSIHSSKPGDPFLPCRIEVIVAHVHPPTHRSITGDSTGVAFRTMISCPSTHHSSPGDRTVVTLCRSTSINRSTFPVLTTIWLSHAAIALLFIHAWFPPWRPYDRYTLP